MMSDDYHSGRKGMHIGIIPDGNRRYAIANNRKPWEGHERGASKLREFMKWCMGFPEIKEISVFALSTDNLVRPANELKALWEIYRREFKRIPKDQTIIRNQVMVRVVGDKGKWADGIADLVRDIFRATSQYSKRVLNLLLAYSTRFEVGRALRLGDVRGLLVGRPLDLVIRTGGQRRLSGFMAYQAQYAEIYFSDTLWPAFTEGEFKEIMKWYDRQVKRWGR
jgi:undecaprenyl pyrophosphate synthase